MKSPSFAKPSRLNRLVLAVASVLAAAVGFAVASVLLAALLMAGLAAGGWLWWQYRRLTRQARATPADFIEGEYRIESELPALEDQRTASAEPADRTASALRRAP